MKARQKVLEQLLVEATDNKPRLVVPGSVRLDGSLLTWAERFRGTPVARCSNVDWGRVRDLVEAALGDAEKATS